MKNPFLISGTVDSVVHVSCALAVILISLLHTLQVWLARVISPSGHLLLLYDEVNKPPVYIHPLHLNLPSHIHSIPLGHHRALS